MMYHYYQLLRVNQWVKNTFIFLPLFFAANLLNKDLFFEAFIGFLCFNLVASAVYIFNDWIDVDKECFLFYQ